MEIFFAHCGIVVSYLFMYFALMDNTTIILDKERLVKIRKACKKTQADLATDLGMSLRTYSAYENMNAEIELSALEFSRLANALKYPAHFLWGSLPPTAVLYWQQTQNHSLVAQFIAEQRFGNLKVDGLPGDHKLRSPLLKLIDTFEEERDNTVKQKLSEQIRTRFECEDAVDELRHATDDIPPRFYIVKVPTLHVSDGYYYGDDTSKDYDWIEYKWATQVDALISFDPEFDPETRALNYNSYQSGKTDIFYDWDAYTDEEIAKYRKDALDARPSIELEETENVELKAEPASFDIEAGEAELKVSEGKKS